MKTKDCVVILLIVQILVIILLIGCTKDDVSKENSKEIETALEELKAYGELAQKTTEIKSEELAQTSEPVITTTEKPTEILKEEVTEKVVEEPILEPVKTNGILEVHFIDVGQADASLVICDDKTMLIDGGNPEDSSLIYSYLKNKGIDHLEYIVSTHPHEDHVGGLAGALNYATVGTSFSPVTSYDSRAFNSFVKYLNEKNVSITVPNAGDTFKLGSTTVQVLGPINSSNDVNNNSIVLKITYGDTSFLFAADAGREEEQDILSVGYDLNSTVIKVGHHGGDTSTTYPFLREVMPNYAVISVGSNNSYGHPTENTLSRLRDADVKVLRTDMQGDIIFTSDGTSVSYTVERNIDANTLTSTTRPTPVPETNKEPSPSNIVEKASTPDIKYILNTNTKKFHYPRCSSVGQMSEKNKKEANLSREEVISQGYNPCGNCKP